MYCPNCGEENIDEAKFCKGCGKPMHGTPRPKWSPSRSVMARPNLSGPFPKCQTIWRRPFSFTIFCCLPFGIVSIVYAPQVNSLVASGRIDSARQASQNAKMWAWISFWVGLATFGTLGFWTCGGINL